MRAPHPIARSQEPREWRRLPLGGDWVAPSGSAILEVRDPASLSLVGSVPVADHHDVALAVVAARRAFDQGPWPRSNLDARIEGVRRLLAALSKRRDDLVRLIVSETGLPIGGTVLSGTGASQVDGAIELIRASIETAQDYPFCEETTGRGGRALVVSEPVGVVVAIVPWNGPLWSALMKIVPAMLAGCTVIVKPSPLAPLDAMVLAECAMEADMPPGVLNVVQGDREVGEALVADPGVDKVSFTGSTAVGREVARQCAANLTRVNLELGGKSAAIVLDDADLDAAVPILLCGGLDNNGESCTALTRIVVSRPRAAELLERLRASVGSLAVGDPFDPAVDIGPLITETQRTRAETAIAGALGEGASVLVGGGRPRELPHGWYLEPTVLADVGNGMAAARDEIFAPVLSVIECGSDAEAVEIANDSPYGLSGAVFSADPERALDVCRQVRTGTLNINGFTINIDAPLGGFKQSGMGREYGVWGLREFVELKTINLLDAADALGGGRPSAVRSR